MMRFNRTLVAIAVTTALATQAVEARDRAEQARRRQLSQAIAEGLKVTDKQFNSGLLGRFRAGLNRLLSKH